MLNVYLFLCFMTLHVILLYDILMLSEQVAVEDENLLSINVSGQIKVK